MSAPRPAPVPAAWAPPVDLARYDRTPVLSAAERAALAQVTARGGPASRDAHALRAPYRALARLVGPLRAALAATGFAPTTPPTAVRAVLREMQRQQCAYWAWGRAEWCAVLAACERDPHSAGARAVALALAYLLGEQAELPLVPLASGHPIRLRHFAARIFGPDALAAASGRVQGQLRAWGYGPDGTTRAVPTALAALLLVARHPALEAIGAETLAIVGAAPALGQEARAALPAIARVLVALGIVPAPPAAATSGEEGPAEGIPPGWLAWCRRWRDTSTLAARGRRDHYYKLLIAGRWLARHAPALADPAAWDYAAAAAYVAAVDRAVVGEWAHPTSSAQRGTRAGQPLAARTKESYLKALRTFFQDLHAWGWLARRFDPPRALRTPPAVRAQIGPAPRVIADDVWGKLLWAGLNLTPDDLAPPPGRPWACVAYPPAMVQALAVTWLFAGLRADELARLPVGCVRWQHAAPAPPGTTEADPGDAVCWLDVPVNKTGPPFTKPVDRLVGEAIAAWERVRPAQPPCTDRRTGRATHHLFANRGKRLGATYLNAALIPLLCRKANIPRADARGPITSHRARSTIASQLFNAREPLSLLELKQWLGHKSLSSTQHYVAITPLRQAKALRDADYFGRALRMVDVLVDKAAVASGAAADGAPWMYYDLGHGYCTHPYFAQCPHRLVCAKCAFYRPKAEMAALFARAKDHLVRLREEIPLTEEERAVVAEDLAGYEDVLARLVDTPALDGRTPPQIQAQAAGGDGERVVGD